MIKPVTIGAVPPKRSTGFSKYAQQDIRDFLSTSAAAGKIEVPRGRKAAYVRDAYYRAAKSLQAPVSILQRGEDICIVRKQK